jgi:hypothetical protein
MDSIEIKLINKSTSRIIAKHVIKNIIGKFSLIIEEGKHSNELIQHSIRLQNLHT